MGFEPCKIETSWEKIEVGETFYRSYLSTETFPAINRAKTSPFQIPFSQNYGQDFEGYLGNLLDRQSFSSFCPFSFFLMFFI